MRHLKIPQKQIREIRELLSLHLKKSLTNSDFTHLVDYINQLSFECSKMIRIKNIADQRRHCFDFAFALTTDKYAVHELLKRQDLIRELDNKEQKHPDDLVIYFVNLKPSHAGRIIKENFIVSKWDRGPIVEHMVFIAPSDYGSIIKYYRIIDKKGVFDFLKKYKLKLGKK